MSDPKAEAREWAVKVAEQFQDLRNIDEDDLEFGKGGCEHQDDFACWRCEREILGRALAASVLPLFEAKAQAEQERDEAKRSETAAWDMHEAHIERMKFPDARCACMLDGKDDVCSLHSPAIAKLSKLTEQLAGLLAFAVENMDSVSGGTLYSQCSTCEFDDHKSNHAEGCPSADWHNRAAAALSAYEAHLKGKGEA